METPAKGLNRLSGLLLAAALVAGIGLRVTRLASVPAGTYCDEECNGYDSYSILTTGRDHHGNFLPIVIQGFNDQRMPLFDYSLIPLIAAFGMKTAVVRLGAAMWGITDLFAITALAGLMFGMPGAAVAALLTSLSPWHLPLSRYGVEAATVSATVSLAMLCFFIWLNRRTALWLILSAAFFGLTLYTNPITKGFTPAMVAMLAVLYRRPLRQAGGRALLAAAILAVIAAPQVIFTIGHRAELQARLNMMSVFHASAAGEQTASTGIGLANFGAGWLGYFNPGFLFLHGDRGDRCELLFPPGFGMLLPEQVFMIAMGLAALLERRRRKLAVLLLGWLMLAAVPAALLAPRGVLGAASAPGGLAFDPWMFFRHPQARHDVLAIAPWILLSVLGLVVMLEWLSTRTVLKEIAVGLLVAGAVFHGGRFAWSYFRDYPTISAPYFYYGMDQVMAAIEKLADDKSPVVISPSISQTYMHVLFHGHYPPALEQREGLVYPPGAYPLLLHPHIEPNRFDRYIFDDPDLLYSRFTRGVFVFAGDRPPPQPPLVTVRLPDGRIAYQVVVKTAVVGGRCSPMADVALKAGVNAAICSFAATTPIAGGPWHPSVTWNAVVGRAAADMGRIECALDDGANKLATSDTLIPGGWPRLWHLDASGGPTYGGAVAKSWTWRCEADMDSTLFAALRSHGTSQVEIDFIPESKSSLSRQAAGFVHGVPLAP